MNMIFCIKSILFILSRLHWLAAHVPLIGVPRFFASFEAAAKLSVGSSRTCTMNDPICTQCDISMSEGFIPDFAHAAVVNSSWVMENPISPGSGTQKRLAKSGLQYLPTDAPTAVESNYLR